MPSLMEAKERTVSSIERLFVFMQNSASVFLAFLVFSLLAASPLSAQTEVDRCIEDGGTARCIGPDYGEWIYRIGDTNGMGSPSGGSPSGWFSTESAAVQAMIDYALSAGGQCTYTLTDQTPAWPQSQMPEGSTAIHIGDVNAALALQGQYVKRISYLSTESHTTKLPYRTERTAHVPICAQAAPSGSYIHRQRPVFCPGNPLNQFNGGLWNPNVETVPLNAYCWMSPTIPDEKKNQGDQCNNTQTPVNAASGNKFESHTDYVGRGAVPLKFVRHYNSRAWNALDGDPLGYASPLGYHWRSNFDAYIQVSGAGRFTTAHVYRPDGRTLYFKLVQNAFVPEKDVADRLTRLTDAQGELTGWRYTVATTQDVESYNAAGHLVSIANRSGLALVLSYDSANRLSVVTDPFGRQLSFGYDLAGRLSTLTDPANHTYAYGYDSYGNLTGVTYPGGVVKTYVYGENNASPRMLTGIVDESNSRFATYRYAITSGGERVTSTERGNGVSRFAFQYLSGGQTRVTDPLLQTRTHTFAVKHGVSKLTAVNRPCAVGCVNGNSSAVTYDANGNVATRTDFEGTQTIYTHDLERNLETSRIEAASTARERVVTTQWHPSYRVPTRIDEPGKRTTFTHDAHGNVLTRTELDTLNNASRTWTNTYYGNGQLHTVDGPRTDVNDVITLTYYSCAGGNACGQVHTVTNALGHVATFSAYNAHGQPLTISDANNVVTTLSYDLRGRLTSSTTAGEQTAIEYWPTGLLKKTTLPDGSSLNYTYDTAHRLTEIEDAEGNRIVYTLDNIGNRTRVEVFDASNALARTGTRVFNDLNRLWKEVGAANTTGVTTTYTYDDNGNATNISAPEGRSVVQVYDELQRLTRVTDPLLGQTVYDYDALDQLVSVTDPAGLTTSYTINGLGDLLLEVSPDRGNTAFTYDSAGNVLSRTDARGMSVGRGVNTYDALNRLTQIQYPDHTVTYGYDTCLNGVGRICSLVDVGGTTTFEYDSRGRVTLKAQTVDLGHGAGVQRRSLRNTYVNGLLTRRRIEPNGVDVTFEYNSAGRAVAIRAKLGDAAPTQTVLSNVIYDADGRVRGWTWGNGTIAVREFDEDGRPSLIDSHGQKVISYDNASRIVGITTDGSSPSWTYGYDALDRLTSSSRSGLTRSFGYDANGNRTSQGGTESATFSYSNPLSSNRLSAISGSLTRAYQHDSAGNVLADGVNSYTYDGAGRMATSSVGAASYAYNGLGQRIVKRIGGYLDAHYTYDDAGHVLEKCAGWRIGDQCDLWSSQQFIWLGDTPVATMLQTIVYNEEGYLEHASLELFNIHTDHLNTPRKLTRADSTNQLVWRWDPDPFGLGQPVGNLANVPYMVDYQVDLRFPGQLYDWETGLHYNYYRDYDPATGRYIQSDPIGLQGGVNTFAYAFGDPVSIVDPLGLRGDVADFLQACVRPTISIAQRLAGGVAGGVGLFLEPGNMSPCQDRSPRPECPNDCAKIEADIAAVAAELRERYLRALRDPKDLYNRARTVPFARRAGTWVGHRQQFMNLQVKLRNLITAADAKGCSVSPDDRLLATAPFPDAPLSP